MNSSNQFYPLSGDQAGSPISNSPDISKESQYTRNAGILPVSSDPSSRRLTSLRSRGYLPHFDGENIPQFITFRLFDSLPKNVLTQWLEELKQLPPYEASTKRQRLIETYLDANAGHAWLADPNVASVVQDALLHFEGERYDLHAWVVMPNHVHVLITPRVGNYLTKIIHSWKSFTAIEANRILGRTGEFWQREYYDRAIRNEKQFKAAIEYIEGNPVKAGLCRRSEDWVFGSACYRRGKDDGGPAGCRRSGEGDDRL